MSRPIACGLDFGTTNSSIAVAYEDRIDVIDVGRDGFGCNLPSVVYIDREGIRLAGNDAVRQFLLDPTKRTECHRCDLREGRCRAENEHWCFDRRLLGGIKSALSEPDFRSRSWGWAFDAADLVSIVMRRLKTLAERDAGQTLTKVVVGHPVVFENSEGHDFEQRHRHALRVLEAAARRAGFTDVVLESEPAAAAAGNGMSDGVVVATDFGGGTFDVAVIEYRNGFGEVAGLQGAAIGGQRFDKLMFDEWVAPQLGIRDSYRDADGHVLPFPAWIAGRLGTMEGLTRLTRDGKLYSNLRAFRHMGGGERLVQLEEILQGGHAYNLFRDIEEGKIRMSAREAAHLAFERPGPPRIDISADFKRSTFESMIGPDLDVIERCITDALEEAGITVSDVDVVLRTGGSGTIPSFVARLDRKFGRDKVRAIPAFESVVGGLAQIAREEWS